MKQLIAGIFAGFGGGVLAVFGLYSILRTSKDKKLDKFEFEISVNRTKTRIKDSINSSYSYLKCLFSKKPEDVQPFAVG